MPQNLTKEKSILVQVMVGAVRQQALPETMLIKIYVTIWRQELIQAEKTSYHQPAICYLKSHNLKATMARVSHLLNEGY